MPIVNLQDGTKLNFPDGTPPQEMQAAIADLTGGPQPAAPGAAGPAQQPPRQLSWGDVATQAVGNIPESAAKAGRDIVAPFLSPIETAKNIGNLALGAAEKLIPGQQGSEKYANAVGRFFASRYGGLDNFKKTIATDPAGFFMDVSAILTGGGGLAARAPGVLGKLGGVAARAGRAVDPLRAVAKGTGAAARTVERPLSNILGKATGTGAAPIRQGTVAGMAGGPSAAAFTGNMRGNIPADAVVAQAKSALSKMKQQRSQEYVSGMQGISKDKAVLDFAPIDRAFAGVVRSMKGGNGTYWKVGKAPRAKLGEISRILTEWRDAPSRHTAIGFDDLKQRIDDLMSGGMMVAANKQSERAITAVRNAVKKVIVDQAPDYANVMSDYSKGSDLITEIEKSLAVGNRVTADAALRKLTAVMRNNVNANYGARLKSVKALEGASGLPITSSIAGQAMSAGLPRGIQGALAIPTAAGAAAVNPMFLPALLASSPRLVGEAAYLGGRSAAGAQKVGRLTKALLAKGGMTPRGVLSGSFQASRLQKEQKKKR